MNNIAILDEHNEDVGLKLLFPECDYFIYKKRSIAQTDEINQRYNIKLRFDIENINDINYKNLFIITRPGNSYKITTNDGKVIHHNYISECYEFLSRTVKLINANNFTNIYMFCTDDIEVDPYKLVYNYFDINIDKKITFFLRNYNAHINHGPNVYSFPFLIWTNNNTCVTELVINLFKYPKCILLDQYLII